MDFNGITIEDIDPDKVLDAAKGLVDSVIVIGRGTDGTLYRASSSGDAGNDIILCELYKAMLINEVSRDG